MSPRRSLLVCLAFLLSATALLAQAQTTTFSFRVADTSLALRRQRLEGGGEIVRVDVSGLEPKLWQGEPGLPHIPYTERYVALPLGARILGIDVRTGRTDSYENVALVDWTQPEQPSADRDPMPPESPTDPETGEALYHSHPTSIPPDPSIGRAVAWPAREQVKLMGTENRAGFQIATIRIHPVQWYPSSELLQFTPSMTVTIEHGGGTLPTPRRAYRDSMDLLEIGNLVANADLIPEYTDYYPTLPEDLDAWYLIITDNFAWNAADSSKGSALPGDMIGEFRRLAEWKTEKGIKAEVVTISDIVGGKYGNFKSGARDLQEVLRNFLKHAYAEFGTYWVVLGGDVSVVPARYVAMEHGSDDSYFERKTNAKPGEGQSYWDEATDTVRIRTVDTNVTETTVILTADTGAAFRKVASPSASQSGWAYATSDTYATISSSMTSFVILRGSLSNTQNKDFYAAASSNSIPTDLYYSSLVGPDYGLTGFHDWDKNQNEVYGQFHGETAIDGVDLHPDLALGRAPVESGAEAKIFVDKVLSYEKHEGIDVDFSHTLLLGSANWSSTAVESAADPIPAEKKYYHAAGSTTAILHFAGAPETEDDLRLVAYNLPGDWWVVPYNRNAGATVLGWFFCTDSTYSTISEYVYSAPSITLRLPIRTAFVKVRGPADDLHPAKYFFDPVAMDRSAREKEELKEQFQDDFPEIDIRKRLYQDLLDVPDYPAPDLLELSSALMQAELNAGYNIVSLSGHGNSSGCCGVNSTIVNQLSNGARTGVLYANSCLTGKFDGQDCFGETLLKRPGGGAVAYVGYSRFGWVKAGGSFENSFWKSLAEDRHLGHMHNSRALLTEGVNARWCNYALNLLGDPEMEVWVETPPELDIDLPIEVAPDLPFWRVTIGERFARVCVKDPRGSIQIQHTGDSDSVTFSTRSFEPGDTLLLTITKPGSVPYQGTVIVAGGSRFIRCDANQDQNIDLSDAVFTLSALFLGSATIQCEDAADANDDGKVDISDARKILDYLFLGGSLPAGTTPGIPQTDPTPDGIGC